jgi:hypothetical protein
MRTCEKSKIATFPQILAARGVLKRVITHSDGLSNGLISPGTTQSSISPIDSHSLTGFYRLRRGKALHQLPPSSRTPSRLKS